MLSADFRNDSGTTRAEGYGRVDETFEKAKGTIESAIGKLGIDAATVRVKEAAAGTASWTMQRGSAAILIALSRRKEDEKLYLRVVSPVMVPDAAKKDALYTRLLELNGSGLANCAFGVIGERVVAVSERPAEGLDVTEAEQMIRHLGAVADTYDDRLVKEFGGRRACDKG
jgi:hypothetical protein